MKKKNIQKILSTVSITGAFVVVGFLVLMMTGVLQSSRGIVDLLIIVGIISFGCISCMSVTRYIDDKTKRVPVLIVLISTGVSCLMWILFIFLGQSFIDSIIAGTVNAEQFAGILTYTKIAIFLTIQTSLANLVISNIFRLRKSMIAFQVVMYASNAIVDFWLSAVVLSVTFNGGDLGFAWPALVESRFWVTLFILALAYTAVSNSILKKYEKRKLKEENVYGGTVTSSEKYDEMIQNNEIK